MEFSLKHFHNSEQASTATYEASEDDKKGKTLKGKITLAVVKDKGKPCSWKMELSGASLDAKSADELKASLIAALESVAKGLKDKKETVSLPVEI